MIKAIIFDFDGLIFDTETCDLRAFEKLYNDYNVEFPKEKWLCSIGSSLSFDPYETLYAQFPEVEKGEFRKEKERHYNEMIHSLPMRDGVIDYLMRAKELRLKTALASSSTRDWIDTHMEKLGILSFFDYIFTADDVTKVKPDPELYQKVLKNLKIMPNEAIVFEDSPNGSLAAIRAEIPCVIVPNETTQYLLFDQRIALRLKSKKEMSLDDVIKTITVR